MPRMAPGNGSLSLAFCVDGDASRLSDKPSESALTRVAYSSTLNVFRRKGDWGMSEVDSDEPETSEGVCELAGGGLRLECCICESAVVVETERSPAGCPARRGLETYLECVESDKPTEAVRAENDSLFGASRRLRLGIFDLAVAESTSMLDDPEMV